MTMTGTKARGHAGTKAHRFRAGYSFTEVMFAVVVLGIGFIMIAAMFPVAISQSAATSEESVGASIARGAVQHISAIAGRSTMRATDAGVTTAPPPVAPFTGIYTPTPAAGPEPALGYPIVPANTGSWQAVKGNLILQTDPRYAYVPFYSRKTGSSFAQLIIVALRVRERAAYDATDVTPDTDANFQPRPVTVEVTNNVGGSHIDWVTVSGPNIAGIAEGTCIVISAHGASGPTPINFYAGQVFRIGRKAVDPAGGVTPPPDTWELVPGNDFIPSPGADDKVDTADDLTLPATTTAYFIGRELETPGTAAIFRGVSQEVSYYTTFVQVRP